MALVEVSLVKQETFEANETVNIPAGETELVIKFPGAVPAGKKAVVRIRLDAVIEDAE